MLRAIGYYFLGTVLLKIGGVVLLPIFTRYLDPGEYGTLELLNRATDILLLCLFLNGFCLAAISFYNQARNEEHRQRVVGSVLVCGSIFIGVIGLAALILAGPIAILIGVGNTQLVRLAFLAALGDAFFTLCLALIQARVEPIRFVAFSVAHLLLRVTWILVLVCVLGWGVPGILLASLVASTTLGLVLLTRELKLSGLHLDRETASGMAMFALPFLPGGICGFLLGTGDQLLLVKYASTSEIGLYALGYKLAVLVSAFTLEPLMKVWGARMHGLRGEPDAPRVFGELFTRFSVVYSFAGLGLGLFGPEIIAFLARPQYVGAVVFIPPVVLAYFFMSGSDLMDAAFYVQRRTQLKLWISLLSAAIMLALYLVLIPPFKGLGAAYATLGGFIARMCLTYLVSQRLFAVAYEWDRVATVLLAAVGCWSLGQLAAGPLWLTTPAKTVILFLFPAVLWVKGLVTPQEKQAFVGFLDRTRQALGKRSVSVSPAARET